MKEEEKIELINQARIEITKLVLSSINKSINDFLKRQPLLKSELGALTFSILSETTIQTAANLYNSVINKDGVSFDVDKVLEVYFKTIKAALAKIIPTTDFQHNQVH